MEKHCFSDPPKIKIAGFNLNKKANNRSIYYKFLRTPLIFVNKKRTIALLIIQLTNYIFPFISQWLLLM